MDCAETRLIERRYYLFGFGYRINERRAPRFEIAVVSMALLLLASLGNVRCADPFHNETKIRTVVPENLWRKMSVSSRTPSVLRVISHEAIPFQSTEQVPLAYLDGSDFGGVVPDAVWVKLEQPGVAIAVMETDLGAFVKILHDASPGFISRCEIGCNGFGTVDGQPAEFESSDLKVKGLWILQDAQIRKGETPGWVAIAPRQLHTPPMQLVPENGLQISRVP